MSKDKMPCNAIAAPKTENIIHNEVSCSQNVGSAPEPWLNDKYALNNAKPCNARALHDAIASILIKNSLRTDQMAIGEIVELIQPCNAVLPDGWVAVPKEPTDEMGKASRIETRIEPNTARITNWGINVWDKIIQAAPQSPILTEKDVEARARREALEEVLKLDHWGSVYTEEIRKLIEGEKA